MKKESRERSLTKPPVIRGTLPDTILCVPYDPPGLPVLKYLQKLPFKEKRFQPGRLFILKKQAVFYGVVGSPALGIGLESLIASGAEKILLFGFCGTLNPSIPNLSAVSIAKAHSDEGTSPHYFPRKKQFLPSPALKTWLEDDLRSQGRSFSTAAVISTDAPFRETPSWIAEQQSKKIDCVDMEVSALFSISEFYGIQAAALLLVSDSLTGGKWKKAFTLFAGSKKIQEYFFPFFEKEIRFK